MQTMAKTVDDIYRECATLFSNLGIDSTKEEREQAKAKEWELLQELKEIEPELYEFFKQTRDA